MAQPETLDRKMSHDTRLVLTCRGCGHRYVATKTQAVKRFGPRATAYEVEQTARCPACSGDQIDVALAGAHDAAALPAREAITWSDARRLGLSIGARCAFCNHGMDVGLAQPTHDRRPLAELYAAGLICCHKCGHPVCGLTVDRRVHNGGSMRETVHAWWEPGSPADPAVLAFWAGVRKTLGRA